ncbi:hypothetical protein DM01DRAFT_1408497 [Hesseltinella vesiculosa]|uniref:DUF1162-domain-containing protein n=1 Tax=Hesseltinella vesiculosa TaxID=101127 RepID=A0A1X2GET2_9FUNG|nr:hypothetical protein DM01DRAFT_1408497 [Hesseltinella vesiculosa]
MLESLVASILNRVLGNYVSNLNYDQLKIAIWNGQVNLHNLKLRRDALDKLRLPIDVTEGYLGELELSIPWANLKTQPVKVVIRNVYLLAKPKSESSITVEEEEERAQHLKQQKLETAELMDSSKQSGKADANDSSSGGFVNQLITKVIDNLQFVMENIHIRYEDHLSCPEAPFAVGLTLKELSAVSTNGEWEPSFIGELTNTIHKLVKLQSLSVYWNTNATSLAGLSQDQALETYTKLIPTMQEPSPQHQYLIKPVSGAGKIKLNKAYDQNEAKVDATLLFEELAFGLDDEQYRDALLLVDLFHANLKKQEFIRFRPPTGVSPHQDPKAYFRFAGQAVLSRIHERNYQWTWDHFKTRRDQRLAYLDTYYAFKRAKATQQQKDTLKKLEYDLSFEDIRFYRSIVKAKLRKEKIRLQEEKQKNANKGWFGSWWSSNTATSTSPSADSDDGDSIVMTEEQKKELYDAIGFDEDVAAMENAIDMPKDTMKFTVRTQLNRGSFQLWRSPHSHKHELTSIVFENVAVEATQYLESIKVAASLGDLQLFDGMTPGTLYPQLIGVKKSSSSGTLSLLKQDHECDGATNDQPFLSVMYQRKPFDKNADSAIKVLMRHLEIIYNPQVLLGILDFFKGPNTESESFNALVQVAGTTLEGFKRQTLLGLEYALEKHTTLDLEVEVDAPLIIVPESLLSDDSHVMIIDAGHIHVDSDLANQEIAQEFKQRRPSADDLERLDALMYDKFNVALSQIKLLIGRQVKNCVAQLAHDHNAIGTDQADNAYLLQRLDLNLLVEKCILPASSQFPQIKVSAQLPRAAVNLSTHKYKTLMRMIDLLLPPSSPDDAQPTNPPSSPSSPKLIIPNQPNKNLLAQQLWGDHEREDIVISDHDSVFTTDSQPRLFRSDTSTSSVTSTIALVTQAQQENFKLTFVVGKAVAYIYDSVQDPTSTHGNGEPTSEQLLCEVLLQDLALDLVNRPFDMSVQVRLKSLDVIDHMQHGSDFYYLVTSNPTLNQQDDSSPSSSNATNDDNASAAYLVDVRYQRTSRQHPRFQELFGGYDQSVNVLLSTLTFVLTRESVLTLYNWILITFTGGNALPTPPTSENDPVAGGVSSPARSYLSTSAATGTAIAPSPQPATAVSVSQPVSNTDNSTMRVNIHLVSVQLIMNDLSLRLATGTLTFGYLEILLLPSQLSVQGKFGNFVLTDDTVLAPTSTHHGGPPRDVNDYVEKIRRGKSNVPILSIEGDELLSFTYATHDPSAPQFPGYHQHLLLRMGSFRLIFNDSFKPCLDFLSQFLAMKASYDTQREQLMLSPTAPASPSGPQPQAPNQQLFHFDVLVKSPIVDFPVSDSDVVSAYLGEIRAVNEFATGQRLQKATGRRLDLPLSRIHCGLYAISLLSMTKDKKDTSPMLGNVDIELTLESLLPPEDDSQPPPPVSANTVIRGHVTDVLLQLTERQYGWLLQIEQKLMTVFFPPAEDTGEPLTKPPAPSNASAQSVQPASMAASMLTSDSLHSLADLRSGKQPAATLNKQLPLTGPAPSTPQVTMDIKVEVALICLEVFHGCQDPTTTATRLDNASLCRFSFDGSQVKLLMKDDGGLMLEAQVQSVNFYDTRKDCTSHFKDFLPAGKQLSGPQLQLQYRQAPATPTLVMVTVDHPQLVLSLDYIMVLKTFFLAPFQGPPEPTAAQTYAASYRHQNETPEQPTAPPAPVTTADQQQQAMQFKINVVDLEIICLAHPDSPASEALVISMDNLCFVQMDQLSLKAYGLRAVLCRMNHRTDSSFTLIEPFNIDLDMETAPTLPGHHITNLQIAVQRVLVRLSYHDLMLILDIVTKVTALLDHDSDQTSSSSLESPSPILPDDAPASQHLALAMAAHQQDTLSLASATAPASSTQTTIEPYIVMSRESLSAVFDGFQLVLVEDLHDLPFLDLAVRPFTLTATDWSRAIKANVKVTTLMNNFNFINSHWEPLMDPYTVDLSLMQDASTKHYDFSMSTKDLLNINITHTFLQSIMAVSSTLSSVEPLPESFQRQMKPYLIRNRTGYDLRVWNMSADAHHNSSSVVVIKNGDDCPWTFRDWRKHREVANVTNNCVGVQVMHDNWESLYNITVDMEGKRSFRLRNKTPTGVQDRLMVGIHLKDHVKNVTFHSGLTIKNNSNNKVEYTMINGKRKIMSPIWTLDPKETLFIPIGLCYRPWIVLRPSDKYHWSQDKVHWSDLVHPNAPTMLTCQPHDASLPEYSFHLHAEFDAKDPVAKQYPSMRLHIGAPIKITNLLPFDFKWTMVNTSTDQHEAVDLCQGKSKLLYTFPIDCPLSFVLDIQSPDYEATALKQLPWKPAEKQEGYVLNVKDKNGNLTQLFVHVGRSKKAKHAIHIKVYCPYLILNKVGYPISVRSYESTFGYKSVGPNLQIPQYDDRVTPQMFSYQSIEKSNRAQISFNGSKWSKPLSFEAVGSSVDISVPYDNAQEIHAGIHIEEGTGNYNMTKMVIVTPRFVLRNLTDTAFDFAEYKTTKDRKQIEVHETRPFYLTRSSRSFKWLCLRLQELQGGEVLWSTPFDIQEVGTSFIKVPISASPTTRPMLVRVSVLLKESTIFVTLHPTSDWPYLVVNRSSTDVVVYQEPPEYDDYRSAFQPKRYVIPAGERMDYSWDLPASKAKRLILQVGKKQRAIDFLAIGTQMPFRYRKHQSLSIDVAAHKTALELRLTDYKAETSLFRPTSSMGDGTESTTVSSSRDSTLDDHFETVTINLVDNYTIRLNLQGIGLSIINQRSQEVLYASIKGVDIKFTDSNLYQSVRVSIQWLQIDNQLFSSVYPILFFPSNLPKHRGPDSNVHPTFHLALDKVKDTSHGVQYFKLFSVLLQEMTFEMDEDLLYSLMEFAQFDTKGETHRGSVLDESLFVAKVQSPAEDDTQALLYFEEFCIQPMRLNLSFVRTTRVSTEDTETNNSPLRYLFNVLTMTIGNVNDAPLKLNALMVENLRASSQDLSSRIMLHYQDQVVYQIHKVVGSADLIGNPVGLFNNLSSGFGELFYEPYQGFITSDRPQDLGLGLARGVGGFMRKSVFGFTDSFSRFTGSIGKGLAMATMDKKFQDRRHMRLTRNKPQHAIYGVTQGVTSFGTSIASGVVGLVKQPKLGAEESGVAGFMAGVGKGLVGAVTKPMVGFFDLASNVSAGIRETTNMFDGSEITRERLPRLIQRDGILRKYSQREALGQLWLKEMADGQYNHDNYVAHSMTNNDAQAVLLSYQSLFVISTEDLTVNWHEPLDHLESVVWQPRSTGQQPAAPDVGGWLLVRTKSGPAPKSPLLTFAEATSGQWFATQVQLILEYRQEEKTRL